ncbi:conjugal transfer protein TrbA [Trinickia fusca]|uniref:Conjugal transfer protein TrbA n=1 Tax=Trinickia fusca TaxID=2419777 RepID=A0A494XD19_9BURK|nr:conjugal transfer protein TrbA [Trinickia fusca]RKP47541.1 conjugal transfer protein TrbA [Trinickia fusca]
MPDQVNERGGSPMFLLGILAFVAALVALWHLKHEAISRSLLIWKAYEVWPAAHLSSTADALRARLGIYYRYARVLTLWELVVVGWQIGAFYLFIPVGFAAWVAYGAWRHPMVRAMRVHTIQSLLEAQSRSFSAVAPVLRRDLSNDRSREWASSVHPEEWVAQQGLIVSGRLDVERTRELLVQQLGKPIASFAEMSDAERALFAVFGLRVFFKDTDASKTLVDTLNYSAINAQSRPDLTLAKAAFERCASSDAARRWLRKHPYPRTLLMALLIEARQMGVLPSSNFIWLKPLDRALWYPLNTAGRKVPFIESAGVFNQMQAEEVAWDNDCQLMAPHVEDAIVGLKKYLEETGILEGESVS